ncbi:MAG TPA: alpha/beta fold hydrolase [Pseudonocardiaceae bacterium]|jgi:pimeloyl-ACP methyl ester carboxylesterase|nr:alpha/beta fold hydrolase [Pseudonocardiaceae bacterium]
MPFLHTASLPARPQLTRVPLSAVSLPPVPDAMRPWPGRELEVDGVRLHVRETPGPAGAPTAVYVHGLGGSATNWTELAGQLAGQVNGIALDLPGFGRSRPAAGTDFTLPAQAEVVRKLIEQLECGPVHLFGNSMGGAISMILAAAHPELVTTLTLVSPAMPDLRPDLRRLADPRFALALIPVVGRPMREALAKMTPYERAQQLLGLCFAEPAKVSQARVELAIAEYAERAQMPWAGTALSSATLGLLRAWLGAGARSMWSVARRVRVPSLVVWGDHDRLVSVRKAPRTAELLARGRLLVLPRTGHVAQMERPATVARAALGMWDAVAQGAW